MQEEDEKTMMYVHFWHPDGSFLLKEGTDEGINKFSELLRRIALAPTLRKQTALYPLLQSMLAPPSTSSDEVKSFYRYALFIVSAMTTAVPVEAAVENVPSNLRAMTLEVDGKSYVLCVYSTEPKSPLFPDANAVPEVLDEENMLPNAAAAPAPVPKTLDEKKPLLQRDEHQPHTPPLSTTPPARITGRSAREEVIELTRQHFGKTGGAAVAGNIEVETGGSFDYQQKQAGGPGYGLFQMEPPMHKAYDAFLAKEGKTDSAASQVEYVSYEVKNGAHIGAGNAKKIRDAFESDDIEQATTAFCNLFEKPSVPHLDRRIQAAKKILIDQAKQDQKAAGDTAQTSSEPLVQNPKPSTHEVEILHQNIAALWKELRRMEITVKHLENELDDKTRARVPIWIAPKLEEGIQPVAKHGLCTPGFCKLGNVVYLRGAIVTTQEWTAEEAGHFGGRKLFTLPQGYRPSGWIKVPGISQDNAGVKNKAISITPAGLVTYWLGALCPGAHISLDGISFVV